MAAEVQLTVPWGMTVIVLLAMAVVLILIGMVKKNALSRSIGLILLGIMVFVAPMAYYLDKVGNPFESFVLGTADIVILSVSGAIGGLILAFGALTYARREVKGKRRGLGDRRASAIRASRTG